METKEINKLDESVKWSLRKLEKFRETTTKAVKQYVGSHYGEGGANRKVPVNLLELATTIYVRLLAARAPKCNITAADTRLQPFAADLELVVNQIPREIGLDRTIQRAVVDAMFGIGVVKVGLRNASEDPKVGDEPFVSLVRTEDYFCDMSAHSWDEVQYEGNDYWMDVETAKAVFGVDLNAEDDNNVNDVGQTSTRSISAEDTSIPLFDRVLLRDVYIFRTGHLITYDTRTNKVLRDVAWDGPEGSPYVHLGFNYVPSNLMPLPPVQLWLDLHELANGVFRKLANQATRKKTLTVFQGGTDEDVHRFKDAADGEAIRSNAKPEDLSVGGVDGGNLAFFIQTKDLYNILAGNIDALGGLSPQADTAAQEKLIGEASSARLKHMGDQVVEFAREIFRRLAWYAWTDPVRERVLRKPIGRNTGITVPVHWTPETRDGDFLDYNLDIDVFSMRDDSPSTRVEKLMLILERVVAPFQQQLMEQGGYVDMRALLTFIGENTNMPNLPNFIRFQEMGMEASRPIAGNPRPEYISTKSPVTHRTYERVNRPGATRHGRDAALMQTLLGGKAQASEMAALSVGREMK
jgi:hypothetical protein